MPCVERETAASPTAGGAGVADAHRVVLEASDGNPLNAFSARALDPNAPG